MKYLVPGVFFCAFLLNFTSFYLEVLEDFHRTLILFGFPPHPNRMPQRFLRDRNNAFWVRGVSKRPHCFSPGPRGPCGLGAGLARVHISFPIVLSTKHFLFLVCSGQPQTCGIFRSNPPPAPGPIRSDIPVGFTVADRGRGRGPGGRGARGDPRPRLGARAVPQALPSPVLRPQSGHSVRCCRALRYL